MLISLCLRHPAVRGAIVLSLSPCSAEADSYQPFAWFECTLDLVCFVKHEDHMCTRS